MTNETGNLNDEKIADKYKFVAIIRKMDFFSFLMILPMFIATILLLKAIFDEDIIPIIVSVFQYAILLVGLLLHKKIIKHKNEWFKYLIIVISVILIPVNVSSYSWGGSDFNDNDDILIVAPKGKAPLSAQDCIEKNFSDVEDAFRLAGFSQIYTEPMEDLEISVSEQNGMVESVSINGESNFLVNAEYNKNDNIVIRYHSVKFAVLPFSNEEVINMKTDIIIETLKNIGFSEVITEEVFDLDPDVSGEFVNSLIINDKESFIEGDKVPLNATVKIITHKPYEKYTVKVVFDFLSNLMFSTYDVEYEFNGITQTLSHGEDDEFEYRLTPGKYEIVLYSAESKSIKNTVTLDVFGDTEVAYKIHCQSDRINIDNLYTENKGAIKEGEAMVPLSAQDCWFENYKDIVKLFETSGFKNISTEIVYDIVIGWTKEGEVAGISIDGNTDFNRGNIFDENADIVITYHMKEDDDPNKPTETTTKKDVSNTTTKPKTTTRKDEHVYFSTNTRDTVYDGNSGIYAYKNKGGTYDVYWIIDFEEGYVYNFIDGNGDEDCDKMKIEYGDLNTYVRIKWTYHSDVLTYGLHFNYVKNPNHLIVDDSDGFASDYYPTDLKKALSIRNSKTIKDR